PHRQTALAPALHTPLRDPPPPENYTLSLHDALPISARCRCRRRMSSKWSRYGASGRLPLPREKKSCACVVSTTSRTSAHWRRTSDRKSTRLNSSHVEISYAVFCLKKKKPISRITKDS